MSGREESKRGVSFKADKSYWEKRKPLKMVLWSDETKHFGSIEKQHCTLSTPPIVTGRQMELNSLEKIWKILQENNPSNRTITQEKIYKICGDEPRKNHSCICTKR